MRDEFRRLLSEMLQASADERREAAQALTQSLADDGDDDEIQYDDRGQPVLRHQAQWLEEIRRRRALDRPGIPGEQAIEEARVKLRAMEKAKAR